MAHSRYTTTRIKSWIFAIYLILFGTLGIIGLGYGNYARYLYFQNVLAFYLLATLLSYIGGSQANFYDLPVVTLPVSGPKLPRVRVRYKRPKHYMLHRRITRRQIRRPIRDAPVQWFNPLTWAISRRIPTPVKIKPISDEVGKMTKVKLPKFWSPLTFEEEELSIKDDYERYKNQLLHQPYLMYELQFGINLDNFLSDIDPLKAFQLITYLQNPKLFEATNRPTPCFATTLGNVAISNFMNLQPQSKLWDFVTCEDNSGYSYALTPEVDYPVVLDTGASMSLTPNKTDFVSKIRPLTDKNIKSLNGSSIVKGIGIIEWFVVDYWNVTRKIRTEAYYVPEAQIRLFSPQTYFQEHNNQGNCVITGQKVKLTLPDGAELEFPYNRNSNLPFMIINKNAHEVGLSKSCLHTVATNYMSVLEQTNQNITATQKELLKWHHRLGHLNFSWCQALFRIPRSDTQRQILRPKLAGVPNCEPPLCAA